MSGPFPSIRQKPRQGEHINATAIIHSYDAMAFSGDSESKPQVVRFVPAHRVDYLAGAGAGVAAGAAAGADAAGALAAGALGCVPAFAVCGWAFGLIQQA